MGYMRGTLKIGFFVCLIATFVGGFFIFGASEVRAANVSSGADGNWSSPSTWASTVRTGTITYVIDSPEIVGTGTAFLTELAVGSIITSASGRGNISVVVASITDDTHLTVTTNAGLTSSGARPFSSRNVPTASDDVTIANGDAVVVDTDVSCASLKFPTGNSASSSLDINAGTLTVSGTVTIPRAASPAFNIMSVNGGNLMTSALAFTNAGTPSAKRHQLIIANGVVAVSGDVTHSGSTGSVTITFVGNGRLKVGGEFLTSATATLTPGEGTIEYNGSGVQTVGGFNYNNLVLSGLLVKTMTAGTTIAGNLSIAPTGTALAKLVVGQDITAGTLLLGGIARASGTWGASDSAADHKDDNYFAASTGRLVVTSGSSLTTTVSVWPTATAIRYGQGLLASTLMSGSASAPGTFSFINLAAVPDDTGTYEAAVIFTPSDTNLYQTVIGSVLVNVSTKELAASITVDDKIYDGTAVASSHCAVEGAISGDELGCVATSASFADSNFGVDKVVTVGGISLTGGDAHKYQLPADGVSVGADIDKRQITIRADAKSKAQGELDPQLTYVLSSGSLVVSDVWLGSLSRVSGETPGTYAISQGDLRVNDNYEIGYVGADLIISERPSVSVTADSKSINYAEADPEFSFQYGALVDGDEVSVIDTPPSCSVLGAHAEAGVYPIVCAGGVDDKYQFSYSSGTLTVRKIAQTISFGELDAKVYGADDFELVASASSGLTVSFAATNEVCSVSGQIVHINRAGECVITAVQNGSNNYEAAPAVTRSFVITKKDLVVSGLAANNKIYDGTDVASLNLADLSLVGLIDEGVIVNTEGVIGRFDNKNIGTEKLVTVSGLTLFGEQAANYNLSQPTARASIAKRELVVMAVTDVKTYDGLTSSTKVPVLSSGSLASGDTAAWTQSFESATVGANKKLIASGVISDANGGNNYQLSFVEDETGVISEVLSAPVVELAAPVVEVKSLGGGGAILNSECKELRLSDWSVCRESKQSRVVIDRMPATCLISEVQKLSLQRDCNSEVPQVLGQKIYPDGSFLKGSSVKIYWIIQGAKYHVKNLAELWSYRPKRVIRVDDALLLLYPDRLTID